MPRRRENGPERTSHRPDTTAPVYTAPAGGVAAPGAIPTEEDRARERLKQRADEVRGGHWRVRQCGRGHIIESHRTNANADQTAVRCPICGDAAVLEAPEATAMREHRALQTPFAIAQNLFDMLADWAGEHLNSTTWTARSDAARAQRLREETRGGGYTPYDL